MTAAGKGIFSNSKELNDVFGSLYGTSPGALDHNTARYRTLADRFSSLFGADNFEFFSSPGRAEITGNHTDHNGGKVLTASISLDTIAAAAPVKTGKITVHSEGYPEVYVIDIADLEPREEQGTAPLIRGLAAAMKLKGFSIGGFNACVTSNVANGSGISSSAAFEMLLLQILNSFYNDGSVSVAELAKMGQYSENNFWHKPSGLLDQMGCGTGGLITIDFKDAENPRVTPVEYDFQKAGYRFLVVHTGGDHGNLTPKYASIPREMWVVAEKLGGSRLCEVRFEDFLARIPSLRKSCGDRAVLRAMHFFTENFRVDEQVAALRGGDFASFVRLITDSGSSSWRILQNCFDGAEPEHQEIPVALSLTECFLKQHDSPGGFRVHGGGFAGVVLVVISEALVPEYIKFIEPYFGKDAAMVLSIRPYGAVNVTRLIAG